MGLKEKMLEAAARRAGTSTPVATPAATPAPAPKPAPVVEATQATTPTTSTDAGEIEVQAQPVVPETPAATPPADKPRRSRTPKGVSAVAAAAPVVDAAPQTEAVAVVEEDSHPVVLATKQTPIGQIAGQISTSDLKLPRLNHVQAVGDLSARFQAGSILLDGEVVIAKPDPAQPMKCSEELYMIPIRAARVLRENFSFKDPTTKDSIPREFPSEEACLAAGGIIDYEQGKNHFRPALNLLAAIARDINDVTEELVPYFVDIDEEAGIALAVCTIRFANSAFTRAGRTIITDQARALRNEKYGLLGGYYSYKLERVQIQSGDWIWSPAIRLLRERTEMSTRELLVSIYS